MNATQQGNLQSAAPAQSGPTYAGFWLRAGAQLIDTILSFFVGVPTILVMTALVNKLGWADQAAWLPNLVNLLLGLGLVLWFWSRKQATPGKMLLGMRIVDASSGAPASMGQYVGRYFGYFVSGFFLCLGMFWIGFDRRKQGWHDKLAGTVVVRRRQRATEAVRFKA